MNTFISTFLGWAFFLGAIFGWTFFLAFAVWRVRIMHKKRLAKKSQRKREEKRKTWLPEPPVLLTPKERREYMLNHIEDGRFYAISLSCGSDTTIVCAQRYDAEEQRLYCYAYLFISGRGIIICISSPLSARPSFATSSAKNDCVLTSTAILAALSLKKKTFLRIS